MTQSTLRLSLPVALGYLPLGAAFGILMHAQGYPWWSAPLMGVVVYAGAAQFLSITLLASTSVSLFDAFIATLVLNMRHIFYGMSVAARYAALPLGRRLYSIFALTDETFALVSSLGQDSSENVFAISFFNHFWWVTGCAAGSLIGGLNLINANGMEYSLGGLFLILLIDACPKIGAWVPLVATLIGCLGAYLTLPPQWFLTGAILSSILAAHTIRKASNA